MKFVLWTLKESLFAINEYGIREAVLSNVLSPKTRKVKCTSSPSTLKRKRSEKFLAENNFEIKQGAWTFQETCLLEIVVSFLECLYIVPSHENVTVMYNFVLTTAEESELLLKANCKSEEQIRGKMTYAKKRQLNCTQKITTVWGCSARLMQIQLRWRHVTKQFCFLNL